MQVPDGASGDLQDSLMQPFKGGWQPDTQIQLTLCLLSALKPLLSDDPSLNFCGVDGCLLPHCMADACCTLWQVFMLASAHLLQGSKMHMQLAT